MSLTMSYLTSVKNGNLKDDVNIIRTSCLLNYEKFKNPFYDTSHKMNLLYNFVRMILFDKFQCLFNFVFINGMI